MSFVRYPKYKNSGVEWLGEVPVHWSIFALKRVSPQQTVGIVVNPSEYVAEDGLPFIYGGDISEGRIDHMASRRISPEDSQRNEKTRLQAGDLLTVRVGAPGITAVVPPECEGGNCASVMLVRRGEFNSDWLCFVMNSRVVRYQVEIVQYGAAQEQFNINHAVDFLIPTPLRREQDAIAAFLNRETAKIDALVAEQGKLIALLQEKRQAVISHAVTKGLNPNVPMKDSGVEWLGEVPGHWDVCALKRLLEIQNGADHKHIEQAEGYPVIGSGGQFAYASDYLYDGESVLLGRKGTIDKPLYVTGKFWTVDTMYWSKIAPDTCGRYAYYTALTIPFGYYSTNTALPSMTQGTLSAHIVARPPQEEQTAIATFLDRETAKLDTLMTEARTAITLLQERRSALISAAVTGQIDVRGGTQADKASVFIATNADATSVRA